jgi:predicted permease
MPTNAAMFLFLAAAVVAVFAFASIVAWISIPARERQARDRLGLLKTLAEHPGDHAIQVLDFLREEDEIRTKKRQREDQRGWIVGGLIVIAVGVGLGVMLGVLGDRGDWSVALIPLLIGCVLLGAGMFGYRTSDQAGKQLK